MYMAEDRGAAGQAKLVLVVEDEADVRRSTIDLMDAMGYRTLEAENAGEALGMLARHHDIDLLLTDVRMPGEMDGAELAFTVRSRWPSIGIVVVSGYFDPKVSRLPAGIRFLSKPYRMAELQAVIDQQMDVGSATAELRRRA